MPMGQEVQQRKDDRKRFLHADHSAKRPFSMELDDRSDHRRVSSDSEVSDNMLAGIIAFSRTVPEHEAEMEC